MREFRVNKYYHPVLLAVFLMLMAFSCESNQNVDKLLINCWTHSYEEDQDDLKVYRPCNYKKYPASRYRSTFTIKENDEVSYLVLSPNDAHYKEDGKWILSSKDRTLLIQNEGGEVKMFFEIKELLKDKMVLKIRNSK